MFDERSSGRRRLLLATAAVAFLALGAVVGRFSAPEGVDPPTAGPGGAQVGFPQSPGGARAAALSYATARLRSILLPPAQRRAMFARIGTPAFAAAAIAEDGREDLSVLGDSAASVRYLTSGLGTRIERYGAPGTRVVVWAMRSLSGVAFPVASFSTQVVDLRWSGSDWEVTAMREASKQAVPRVLQGGPKQATNAVLSGLVPASYGTP